MQGGGESAERPSAGKRQRKKELIGKMSSHRNLRGQIFPRLLDGAAGHGLGAHPPFAESGEHFRDLFAFHGEDEHVSRSAGIGCFPDLQGALCPCQLLSHHGDLPFGNRERQAGNRRPGSAADDRTAFEKPQRRQPLLRRHPDPYASAPGGIKAGALQDGGDVRSHPVQQRQKSVGEKIEGGCRGVVGSPFEQYLRGPAGQDQCRQHRLQHQGAASCGADGKPVPAGAERERLALLGQMAASVSHNLRNPLSSMQTILQVQLENPDLPAGARHDCGLALGEIDRMSTKLKQLLNFAKPSASGQRVAAVALAKETAELFRHDAERRNVILEFDAPPEEVRVLASEEALSEVLSNLVVNAIEAQPDGGRVQIALARRDDRLEIRIEDSGPGISPEVRAKMFQPFFTTKATGTGLGLTIVARRASEVGGTISCESPVADGKGTRFRLMLPLADCARSDDPMGDNARDHANHSDCG